MSNIAREIVYQQIEEFGMEPSEYGGADGRIQPRKAGGEPKVNGPGNVPIQDAHVELTPAEMAAVERKANKYEANGVPDKTLEEVEAELRGES